LHSYISSTDEGIQVKPDYIVVFEREDSIVFVIANLKSKSTGNNITQVLAGYTIARVLGETAWRLLIDKKEEYLRKRPIKYFGWISWNRYVTKFDIKLNKEICLFAVNGSQPFQLYKKVHNRNGILSISELHKQVKEIHQQSKAV
jgi:hypothetical protein